MRLPLWPIGTNYSWSCVSTKDRSPVILSISFAGLKWSAHPHDLIRIWLNTVLLTLAVTASLDSQLHLVNLGGSQGSPCIPLPCAEMWKWSFRVKLGQVYRPYLFTLCLPLFQSDVQYLKILVFCCFRQYKSSLYYCFSWKQYFF